MHKEEERARSRVVKEGRTRTEDLAFALGTTKAARFSYSCWGICCVLGKALAIGCPTQRSPRRVDHCCEQTESERGTSEYSLRRINHSARFVSRDVTCHLRASSRNSLAPFWARLPARWHGPITTFHEDHLASSRSQVPKQRRNYYLFNISPLVWIQVCVEEPQRELHSGYLTFSFHYYNFNFCHCTYLMIVMKLLFRWFNLFVSVYLCRSGRSLHCFPARAY